METVKDLLLLLLTAVFAENAVFTRCYSCGTQDWRRMTARTALEDGAVVCLLSVFAGLSGWLGRLLVGALAGSGILLDTHLRPPLYLLVFIVFYFLLWLLFAKIPVWKPAGIRFLGLHTALAFGYVPMGVLLIVGLGAYTLPEALVFGLGTGAGYLLAMELTVTVRRRMVLSRIPPFLRGLPVNLIVYGLISLGLYALLGHDLAL